MMVVRSNQVQSPGFWRRQAAARWLLAAGFASAAAASMAATSTDTDFQGTVQRLTDWIHGSLGSTIRLAMFIVGMGIGVVTQRLAVPLFSTITLYMAPAVIDRVFAAIA